MEKVKGKLVQRLDQITSELKKIEAKHNHLGNSFHRLGLLRQESMDIRRKIKRDQLTVLLLKLAVIDPIIWRLIEFSKIKNFTPDQQDQILFDNLF